MPGDKPKVSQPRPPRHLSRMAKAWWREIASNWRLDAHHLAILSHAATCMDRAEVARKIILEKGAFVPDRYGAQKENPAIKAERDSMALFARLVRELGLDPELPAERSRPPLLQNRYKDRR